jgi:hypothetical protein
MPLPNPRLGLASLLVLTLPVTLLAQTPREPASKSSSASARSSTSAKGPLPDPVLLDGSAMEEEKRPEYGMLGEFDMPGSESADSDKVGGDPSISVNVGVGIPQAQGQQMGVPQGGGGASGGATDQAPQAAGGGGAGGESQQQPGGGSSPGGQGDASADGTQVGEMAGSNGASQGGSPPPPSGKPQQVALGDSAMQIKSSGAAPGVVGAEKMESAGKDVPQQYDARTPGGGKQSGSGRGNQGVEKGRVMPSGI